MIENLVIVIHGYMDDGGQMWHPWIKNKFTRGTTTVLTPTFPNPEDPKFDEWNSLFLDIIQSYKYNKLFVIGHSLGGFFVLKVLQEYLYQNTKLSGILLISPITDNDSKFTLGFMKEKICWGSENKFHFPIIYIYSIDDHTVKHLHRDLILKHMKNCPKFEYFEYNGCDHFYGLEHEEISVNLSRLLEYK